MSCAGRRRGSRTALAFGRFRADIEVPICKLSNGRQVLAVLQLP
jgi:hypothetical protein